MTSIRSNDNLSSVLARNVADEVKNKGVDAGKSKVEGLAAELKELKAKLSEEGDSLSPRERKKISKRIKQIEKFFKEILKNVVSSLRGALKEGIDWLLSRNPPLKPNTNAAGE